MCSPDQQDAESESHCVRQSPHLLAGEKEWTAKKSSVHSSCIRHFWPDCSSTSPGSGDHRMREFILFQRVWPNRHTGSCQVRCFYSEILLLGSFFFFFYSLFLCEVCMCNWAKAISVILLISVLFGASYQSSNTVFVGCLEYALLQGYWFHGFTQLEIILISHTGEPSIFENINFCSWFM